MSSQFNPHHYHTLPKSFITVPLPNTCPLCNHQLEILLTVRGLAYRLIRCQNCPFHISLPRRTHLRHLHPRANITTENPDQLTLMDDPEPTEDGL